MVLWSKEQDKQPDADMSGGAVDMKKDGPLSLTLLASNGIVRPVLLSEEEAEEEETTTTTTTVRPESDRGEYELTEVTSFTERAMAEQAEEDRADLVAIVPDCHADAKGQREEDALLENGSQSNESDDTASSCAGRSPEPPPPPLKETSFSIGLQVVFPFLLAGFGTVAAGMVLDIVQVR